MTTPPTFKPDDIELIPDAWGRFERAVDAAVQGGPQHRVSLVKEFDALISETQRLADETAALFFRLQSLPPFAPGSE